MVTDSGLARLAVRLPAGNTYTFPLSDLTTIGRGPDCTLTLDDTYCSRNHARIVRQGESYVLTDEGSRNGTLVGGQQVGQPRVLSHGDEIQMGMTTLVFLMEPVPDETLVLDSRLAPSTPLLEVDLDRWEVTISGKQLEPPLSVLEFRLLAYLYSREQHVCTRDQLGNEVWGEGQYTYEMLHQLAHRLRQRIEPDPANPKFVQAVRGAGYKLSRG